MHARACERPLQLKPKTRIPHRAGALLVIRGATSDVTQTRWAQAPLFNVTYGFVFVFTFNWGLGKNSKRDPRDQASLPCVFWTAHLSINTSGRPWVFVGLTFGISTVCSFHYLRMAALKSGLEEQPPPFTQHVPRARHRAHCSLQVT